MKYLRDSMQFLPCNLQTLELDLTNSDIGDNKENIN